MLVYRNNMHQKNNMYGYYNVNSVEVFLCLVANQRDRALSAPGRYREPAAAAVGGEERVPAQRIKDRNHFPGRPLAPIRNQSGRSRLRGWDVMRIYVRGSVRANAVKTAKRPGFVRPRRMFDGIATGPRRPVFALMRWRTPGVFTRGTAVADGTTAVADGTTAAATGNPVTLRR